MEWQDMIRVAVIDSLCWPMRVVIPVIRDPVDGDYTKYVSISCSKFDHFYFILFYFIVEVYIFMMQTEVLD